ncbi:MAG TPA: PspC domain-containing protein [Herpetosiphonaceae bacterium]
MQSRLTRSRTDRVIGGVCSGLGYYFGIDPVIVRLIFVVLAFTTFVTPIIYPILWLITPEGGSPSALPPDARYDPQTGQPLPPRQTSFRAVSDDHVYDQSVGSAPQSTTPPSGRNRMLGFLLLGIGTIALLSNVGDAFYRLFGVDLFGIMVPLLLVGLGMYLLRRKTV